MLDDLKKLIKLFKALSRGTSGRLIIEKYEEEKINELLININEGLKALDN